mgnify:FL=1
MTSIRTRRQWLAGAGSALLMLAGCAGLPRTVSVTNAQMSARLAEQFPIERRWLQWFDLRLSDPRVTTVPERQRVRTELDLHLADRFEARLVLEAGVRIEPADQSLRLHDVRIDAYAVDPSDSGQRDRLGRLPARLLAPWFEDLVVHRLGDDTVARLRREGLSVRQVDVTERGLQFTIDRAP